ncbi:hypothetical protein [Paraburkholderia humisilvae]|nr:hypothetical protein [Paraburkholderia humisilvae]
MFDPLHEAKRELRVTRVRHGVDRESDADSRMVKGGHDVRVAHEVMLEA